jgi:hypothetical protein
MALTWKDAAGTLLTACVVAIAVARVKGWELPLLTNWRLSVVTLFVLGIATCIIIGSGATPENNTWTIIASVLGGIAALLLVVGLIFDSQLVFIALAADIVTLWAITTLHHMVATS